LFLYVQRWSNKQVFNKMSTYLGKMNLLWIQRHATIPRTHRSYLENLPSKTRVGRIIVHNCAKPGKYENFPPLRSQNVRRNWKFSPRTRGIENRFIRSRALLSHLSKIIIQPVIKGIRSQNFRMQAPEKRRCLLGFSWQCFNFCRPIWYDTIQYYHHSCAVIKFRRAQELL
jgi:hypothetical protein